MNININSNPTVVLNLVSVLDPIAAVELYTMLRYVRATEKAGRCHAIFSEKLYGPPEKGPRSAIKLIELYGTTWPFSGGQFNFSEKMRSTMFLLRFSSTVP